jgi:hypothetical protein
MPTLIALLALFAAVAALVIARRQAREVARLKEMYWQLKYDHGELKAAMGPAAEPPPAVPASAFVPLGAVKRHSS